MPTNNPKISAYVPQYVFDRFKQYEKEQGLSMSQAVAGILIRYFELTPARRPAAPPAIPAEVVERIASLERKVELLEKIAIPAPASLNSPLTFTSEAAGPDDADPAPSK